MPYLIIICQDGLLSTAEELQQFANLPMLLDIETTRIVPMTYDDADGPPADSKERQICAVNGDQRYSIEYITRGESINVWFKGMSTRARLARSLESAQGIAAEY